MHTCYILKVRFKHKVHLIRVILSTTVYSTWQNTIKKLSCLPSFLIGQVICLTIPMNAINSSKNMFLKSLFTFDNQYYQILPFLYNIEVHYFFFLGNIPIQFNIVIIIGEELLSFSSRKLYLSSRKVFFFFLNSGIQYYCLHI